MDGNHRFWTLDRLRDMRLGAEAVTLKTALLKLYENLDLLEREVESGKIMIPPARTNVLPSKTTGMRPKEKLTEEKLHGYVRK